MNDSTPNTFPDLSVDSAKRAKSRDSLFLVADLAIHGRPGPLQVRVRNLSPGGLMAEYAHPLDIGNPVDIDLRGVGRVTGQVAWSAAGRIGIAFDNPIDPLKARKPVSSRSAPTKSEPLKPLF
ncbi:MAG: PilZ domain-containing protein [Sphingomonas sp.]|uniref:PilZ domain-containing protein n=1 Tax=Sphingomonas sp. TaxID=28214 RepID=UPI001AC7DDB7|nr:PilZ domain-containing protein [Sphingomonas sp.]MBN8814903.1 PilZ domain-containing protein [Sphingomonas sp.]